MSTFVAVAKRIEREVGLSRTVSLRIARKLNQLAQSVEWATPVEDDRQGKQGRATERSLRTSGSRKAPVKSANKRR